ncbi:hypothetical protein [Acinetobacter gyllenbergii]|uniref:hypothetical protein n=1 Tax=Acinetobacter gyllenbergii TaxID=134534 RepID=UPI003AF739E1
MQNDSNVQNKQAETLNTFPFQLAEDMYNTNVQFQSILHVPTLNVGHNVPEKFEEFLQDMDTQNADDLILQYPQLREFIEGVREYSDKEWSGEHATNLIRHYSNFEFLIELYIAIPRNFRFNEKGEYLSNSLGGHYRCQWIFATTMKDAAEQGIKLAEQIHAEEEAKARKEQGLEG